jgi:hypothetical protein
MCSLTPMSHHVSLIATIFFFNFPDSARYDIVSMASITPTWAQRNPSLGSTGAWIGTLCPLPSNSHAFRSTVMIRGRTWSTTPQSLVMGRIRLLSESLSHLSIRSEHSTLHWPLQTLLHSPTIRGRNRYVPTLILERWPLWIILGQKEPGKASLRPLRPQQAGLRPLKSTLIPPWRPRLLLHSSRAEI